MKKRYKSLLAISLAFSLMLTGCSLGKDEAKEATEYLNDENIDAPDEASTADTIADIFEELIQPDFNDQTSAPEEEEKSEEVTEEDQEPEEETEEDKVTMVFFGDSQFANGRNDGTDIPTLVSQRVPNSRAINLGIGGTTAALETSTSDYEHLDKWTSTCFVGMAYAFTGKVDRNNVLAGNPDVLNSMNSVDPADVDYYFIEYGANDFFSRVEFDQWNSTQDPAPAPIYTYYSAMLMGIDALREASPNAWFFIVTPFYGLYTDGNGAYLGDTYIVSNGIGTLADYAKKTQNVVEALDRTLLIDTMVRTHCDLYLDTASQYLQSDNIHLSETGRRIFARIFAHYPNGFESNEPKAYRDSDFINVAEFDPDEFYRLDDGVLAEHFPEEYEKLMNGEYKLVQPY